MKLIFYLAVSEHEFARALRRGILERSVFASLMRAHSSTFGLSYSRGIRMVKRLFRSQLLSFVDGPFSDDGLESLISAAVTPSGGHFREKLLPGGREEDSFLVGSPRSSLALLSRFMRWLCEFPFSTTPVFVDFDAFGDQKGNPPSLSSPSSASSRMLRAQLQSQFDKLSDSSRPLIHIVFPPQLSIVSISHSMQCSPMFSSGESIRKGFDSGSSSSISRSSEAGRKAAETFGKPFVVASGGNVVFSSSSSGSSNLLSGSFSADPFGLSPHLWTRVQVLARNVYNRISQYVFSAPCELIRSSFQKGFADEQRASFHVQSSYPSLLFSDHF